MFIEQNIKFTQCIMLFGTFLGRYTLKEFGQKAIKVI